MTINVQSGATVTGTNNGIAVNNNNTVNNAGTITGTTANFPDGNGIAAGFPAQFFPVVPGAPGAINLTVNNASTGVIQGDLNGIFGGNDTGTSVVNVNNSGRILGTNAGGSAAIAADNVNVTNNLGGTISGTAVGVVANNIANVVNYGTISGSTSLSSSVQANIGNITNYGLINTIGQGGTPISINSGLVTNYGIITAGTSGNGGTGISLGTDATVINNNVISANRNASVGIGSFFGNTDTVTITNNASGVIQANGNNVGPSGSFGIKLQGGGGAIIGNAGTISAIGTSGTGISTDGITQITNSGTVTATGNHGEAISIGNNSSVVNAATGLIAGGFGNQGGAIIVGSDDTISNAGIITAGTGGVGIIFLNANSALGPVNIYNSGTISVGTSAAGIAVLDNTTIVNAATGRIIAGTSGTGIVAGINNLIYNYGFITVGTSGIGVQFTDVGSTFNNFGTVTAGATGFSLEGCSCVFDTNVNNMPGGTLDGKIRIFGGNNTVTNSGLVTITNAGTPIGPGAYVLQNDSGQANTYIQTSTGTLALRMNNTGAVDQLTADALNLTGTLRIVIQPQLYPNVLTSTNTAVQVTPGQPPSTTTFSSFAASSPFFTVTPIYTGTANSFTAIDIQLGRLGFGSVPGETRNQQTVGNMLESGYSPSINPTSVAGQFYANLLAAPSVGVLDNLSGEGTAALQNASIGAGSQFNNATLGQLVFGDTSGTTSIIIPPSQYAATPKPRGADAFDSVLKAPPAPATQTGRWRLWTVGFGGYRSIDGNASPIGSASQTIRNYGGAFGFDYQASPDLLLGFAAGGSEANVSVPDRATTGRLIGGHLGVYGLKTWGAYYLAASANYARFDNSTTRTIAGIGPTESATGSFASDQLSARFELGWKRAFANYTLTPFVAIEPAALWARGYTETSTTLGGAPGVLGLSFAPRTTTSLPTFLGVQADTRMVFHNGAVLSPYARVSWVHEFEPSRQITATLVSLPVGPFTVDGARPARDGARVDAGSKIQLDTTRSLFANFSGEWSGISQSYSAMAGFKVVLQ